MSELGAKRSDRFGTQTMFPAIHSANLEGRSHLVAESIHHIILRRKLHITLKLSLIVDADEMLFQCVIRSLTII